MWKKKKFLARVWAKKKLEGLALGCDAPIRHVQIDEMETFEHTRCKPVSIAIAVDASTRKILGFELSVFRPPTPALAEKSRKKYGFRPDTRREGVSRLLRKIHPIVDSRALIESDRCHRYPEPVKRFFPKATHKPYRSRRACVVGMGELKEGGYDPLFALNHTCAMIRDNMACMIRRTWCTTKKLHGLEDHLTLYMLFHNTVLVGQ